MRMRFGIEAIETTARWLSLMLVCAVPAVAQTVSDNSGSASGTYFSASRTDASGGTSTSTSYKVTASIGEIAGEATSVNYRVVGGFAGSLDADPTKSGPWLTGTNELYFLPRAASVLRLLGAGLNAGTVSVTVSGQSVSVTASTPTEVAVQLPILMTPGWHRIELTNSAGMTSLERGIGVLPMVYGDGAPGSNAPFDIVFKGTKGDLIAWAVGAGTVAPIRLGSYLDGLRLDPSFIRVLPSLQITANSGELRFPIPPVPFLFTAYMQAVFVSTTPGTGYRPGSFSNVMRF